MNFTITFPKEKKMKKLEKNWKKLSFFFKFDHISANYLHIFQQFGFSVSFNELLQVHHRPVLTLFYPKIFEQWWAKINANLEFYTLKS